MSVINIVANTQQINLVVRLKGGNFAMEFASFVFLKACKWIEANTQQIKLTCVNLIFRVILRILA